LVSDSGTKWLQPSIVISRLWAKAGGTRYARIPASPAVVRLTNCRRVTRFIHASPLEHSVCGEESQETEPVVLAKTGPKIGQIQDARQERSKIMISRNSKMRKALRRTSRLTEKILCDNPRPFHSIS